MKYEYLLLGMIFVFALFIIMYKKKYMMRKINDADSLASMENDGNIKLINKIWLLCGKNKNLALELIQEQEKKTPLRTKKEILSLVLIKIKAEKMKQHPPSIEIEDVQITQSMWHVFMNKYTLAENKKNYIKPNTKYHSKYSKKKNIRKKITNDNQPLVMEDSDLKQNENAIAENKKDSSTLYSKRHNQYIDVEPILLTYDTKRDRKN